MTPKGAAAKAATKVVPGENTSSRPASKPESLIKAGNQVTTRGQKRKTLGNELITAEEEASGLEGLTGSCDPKPKKGKSQPSLESDNSSDSDSSSSSSDSESDSDDSVKEIELSTSMDQLSRSASSLGVRDADMEDGNITPAFPQRSKTPKAKTDGVLPSKDLAVQEEVDWAKDAAIADAKKARKEAAKAGRKEKRAKARQEKLAKLAADRLAGKPPTRNCSRCKSLHWEEDPCPPKPPKASKEASKTKPSSSKRKLDEAGKKDAREPSKKGKGRISNVDLGKDLTIRAVAGRSTPRRTTAEFQDGTHCYLNLSKYSKDWQKGKPLEKGFSVMELTLGMRAVGLSPVHASNQSGASTLEWLIRFGSSSDATEAVDKPFTLRGVEVRLTPYFQEGPRSFICKSVGPISMDALIKSIHEYAPKSKFGLKKEEYHGCAGDKCLLTFGQSQNFNRISLIFKNVEFTVAFVPLSPVPPCAICMDSHSTSGCFCLVPVPGPPDSYYDNSIA